uniref:Uncharacterized protein n=1 Tax=Branchiostoma floridae TaxID=7739 RepID=C3ZIG3_BRAFL|eukprot:XP_002591677.1 hypothetical protein BRAFLDRAFT_80765 [Branchiostoma floridae]
MASLNVMFRELPPLDGQTGDCTTWVDPGTAGPPVHHANGLRTASSLPMTPYRLQTTLTDLSPSQDLEQILKKVAVTQADSLMRAGTSTDRYFLRSTVPFINHVDTTNWFHGDVCTARTILSRNLQRKLNTILIALTFQAITIKYKLLVTGGYFFSMVSVILDLDYMHCYKTSWFPRYKAQKHNIEEEEEGGWDPAVRTESFMAELPPHELTDEAVSTERRETTAFGITRSMNAVYMKVDIRSYSVWR